MGDITDNKFIASQSFLSSDVTPTSSKREQRVVVYGLVARYGPQAVNPRRSVNVCGDFGKTDSKLNLTEESRDTKELESLDSLRRFILYCRQ